MDAYDINVMRKIAEEQRGSVQEQNVILFKIVEALDKIADKLEAIEMSVRKN